MAVCSPILASGAEKPLSGPIVPLFAYEKAYIRDKSRLKAWLKSRQIGGSFTATLEVALDAVETGEDWNLMSRSLRQAGKLLQKCAKHIRAINKYTVEVLKQPPIVLESEIGTHRIKLVNGAVIEAMPCDPDTTTGDTCNWLLDEVALFKDFDIIFAVIKPSIMHGKKLRLLSSARGRNHKFFKLWERWQQVGKASGWSWHVTTIEDALSAGMTLRDELGNAVTLEAFKAQELADMGQELYNREYMCIFSDKMVSFLTYNVIVAAQSANCPLVRSIESLAGLGRELFLGVDVGRKHDLTVGWLLSKTGETYTTEGVYVLERMPFEEQQRVFTNILKAPNVVAAAIDQQGIGMQLAENLAALYPSKVIPTTFTNSLKAEIAYRLQIAMSASNFWIPADDDIVEDFASVERDLTDSGLVRIAAPRSSGGHADRFWAACLSMHVAAIHRPFQLVLAM